MPEGGRDVEMMPGLEASCHSGQRQAAVQHVLLALMVQSRPALERRHGLWWETST